MGELEVPANDGRRVPRRRIVRRVGRRLRGGLGGWILALADIAEPLRSELNQPGFPHEFPDTTTGDQAFAFIQDAWQRARSSPERLANQVRDILPAAYAYCLEDLKTNEWLSERWQKALPEAAVSAEREWVYLAEAEQAVYFDGLEDRRFFPSQAQLLTATGGHLGNIRDQQLRTAAALDLLLLSSVVEMDWHETGDRDATEWIPRLELIAVLLAEARGTNRIEKDDETDTESSKGLRIRRMDQLDLKVSVQGAPAERVPVNARLAEGVLVVAGKPIQFAADAAKELLRGFGFRQRGDLAADLTGMLGSIDEASDFFLAVSKFARSFTPGFELPAAFQVAEGEGCAPGIHADPDETEDNGPPSGGGGEFEGGAGDAAGPGGEGGSFDRGRALAPQEALAEKLKKALKGELEPGDEGDYSDDSERSGGDTSGELGDEIYRDIAAEYERLAGREPDLGDPHRAGWDLRSVDPATGSERLIEVKGKRCPWTEDEVVELSRAQVRKAFGALAGQTTGTWYLYVVERTEEGSFQVLPIVNPVQLAGKWILRGESWRLMAEEPRQVAIGMRDSEEPEE